MLAFSAVLALIIGIGTGAVTTLFGAMNASVLRPLPGISRPVNQVRLRGWAPGRRQGHLSQREVIARGERVCDS